MKKRFIFLTMLVSLLVFGLAFVSCDLEELFGDGEDFGQSPPPTTNRFTGTWEGNDPDGDFCRIVFTSTNWTLSWPGNPQWGSDSGTYTFSGNFATLREGNDVVANATISGNNITFSTLGGGSFTLTRRN